MLTSRTTRDALAACESSQAEDCELLRQLHTPNPARLWQAHPTIFERGGMPAELPAGWEQRVEGKSGRVFYVNHNERATCWADPRVSASAAAGDSQGDHGPGDAEELASDEDGSDTESEIEAAAEGAAADEGAGVASAAETENDRDARKKPSSAAAPSAAEHAGGGGSGGGDDDEGAGGTLDGANEDNAGGASSSSSSSSGSGPASGGPGSGSGSGPGPSPPEPILLLPLVGRREWSRWSTRSAARQNELGLLEHPALEPSHERLLRRAALQHDTAREALLRRLPP
jgi:hypothetical protein